MQISNPVISQYLNSTVSRTSQADRFPVKSVTIEGQVLNDDKKQSSVEQASQDAKSQTQSTQLIPPVYSQQNTSEINANSSSATNNNGVLLSQANLGGNAQLATQNESTPTAQGFPFGSRRSFQGLAGGSLVVQNYLNNESGAQNNNSSGNLGQRNIDLFI